MNTDPPPSQLGRTLSFAVGIIGLLSCVLLQAQSITGAIEGRVFNPANGVYLERARITIEGTAIETFTDSDGNYRLSNVPAGTARVTAFFTGLTVQTRSVTISGGQVVQHDINLSPPAKIVEGDSAGPTIRLSEFVVGASREMDALALAINEQRFASNIKNVVSADEFGAVADGNVAEFMKFLPGVTIDYVGGDAFELSINGVPAANVPVTMDGFSIASSPPNNTTGRATQIGFLSTNSLSRIEVAYSPTPESQGAALAGSVNMIPRSAFERSRPTFNGSIVLLMRDNARDFKKTPGPGPRPERKVHPGFEFSSIVPVNRRFGFTLSGGKSKQYSGETYSVNAWRGAAVATNGNTFPHTTPDKPYLSTYRIGDRPKVLERSSLGVTLDYKLTKNDRVSLSFQYFTFGNVNMNRILTFNVNRVPPGSFTTEWTHGFVGAGNIVLENSGFHRENRTSMPTIVWRHDGTVWKFDAGAGYSHGTFSFRDVEKGLFRGTTARRTGVTVSFDDIFYLRPGRITVLDGATGAPVDPYSLGSYALATASSEPHTSLDVQRSVYANLRRDFCGRLPFTLKAGLDARSAVRDLRGRTESFTHVGADGRSSTTPIGSDDQATPVLDASFSERIAPFGFPRIQWVGNMQTLEYYRANPGHFALDANNLYRSEVSFSKRAEEVISSAYIRGDVAMMDRRLKLISGVRAEQTNIHAEGPLTDPTRNYQRDARGQVIRGANGVPLPLATNPLEVSRLTFIDRGSSAEKEYLRFFPSLNASFTLRENLVARAAYYYSIGRPEYNQYAGGVTLPNLENPPGPTNRIQVNNVGIKAWSARTVNVRMEYYFEGVGQISVGAFRREFDNFFGGLTAQVTPEFLALYGLDPALYGDYDVTTQYNVQGTVRMEGTDFNYKQALTFLPPWARGVQVFANASAQRATGPALGNFTGAFYVPRSASWGLSLTRERYNFRMNWNYRGRSRKAEVAAGPSIEPGTYNWRSKRLSMDVMGEYQFTKNFAMFANLRNLSDEPDDLEVAGPSTPPESQFRQRQDFGSLWTFGIRSRF